MVLTAGRGTSGGVTLWQSGFLPSIHEGVRFRTAGSPILNLANPDGLPTSLQRKGLNALARLHKKQFEATSDEEIQSRISNYELAFCMQAAAPESMDLSGGKQSTLDDYGVNRPDPKKKGNRGGGPGTYASFANNCLLARRMVERGVHFVNIFRASWDPHSGLDDGLAHNCGMADQPIAALIRDLKERGLLDSTMVAWGSEFGRAPRGENRPGYKKISGRDHHPKAFGAWLAGGGCKGGLSYGETDEIGWEPGGRSGACE